MTLMIFGCGVMLLGGLCALAANRRKAAAWAATAGVWLGCGLAAVPVAGALGGRAVEALRVAWAMPGGSLSFGLDALSAFFCLPILLIAPLAAFYGRAYMAREEQGQGPMWFFYAVLVASMLLLTTARNGLLFLVVWEVMALSSFFLVVTYHDEPHVREAGWTYLIATHIGTVVLLVFFALLAAQAGGSLDFDSSAVPAMGGLLFALAVIGFGTKAGFVPLHVWLPEAHPAAPSHVSALMSGVMIKTGIYGLLRALTLLGPARAEWGWTLIIIGLVSGVVGAVLALVQHDIKRILAYSSVENIGIVAIGIGTGILGRSWDMPALVVLGFGGALLHVLNHAVFKSLLFLGAGAVAHATGTRNIESLGGLLKKMRWTGAAFLVASAAIAGLPPLNGFIGEFLLYGAGLAGASSGLPWAIILAAIIVGGLALIGGLTAACFARIFGIAFLGEPRSESAAHSHEVGASMRWPMVALAGLCVVIGFAAPFVLGIAIPAVGVLAGGNVEFSARPAAGLIAALTGIVLVSALLVGLSVGLFVLRRCLPRGKERRIEGTWDCGYARPTARMQYTASSFAQLIADLFRSLLRTRRHATEVEGLFPRRADFRTETPDPARERLFAALFRVIDRWVSPVRSLHHGRIHLYLLYIAITLVALLIWKAGFQT